MLIDETEIRVRYAETDQMGYVYYGNYATYFEVARTESIRRIGLTYKEMEVEHQTMLPVARMEISYRGPAKYDDHLRVVSRLAEIPTGASITFEHEVHHPERGLLVEGMVKLVFVDAQTMRPKRAPAFFLEKLQKVWSENT